MFLNLHLRAQLLPLLLCALALLSCSQRGLRGHDVASPDGGTYLVVDDNNGGGCGPIRIDGRAWPIPIDKPHPIAPGVHSIQCGDGGAIQFTVVAGTTFHFDYWGP